VSSVSCIYGIGNPDDFNSNVIYLEKNQQVSRNLILQALVNALYSRTDLELSRGKFRVKGDTLDVYPAYSDTAFRIIFWGDEVDRLETIEAESGKRIETLNEITIFPANIFVTSQDKMKEAVHEIQDDMFSQVAYYKEIGKFEEAKRLEDRVTYDIEMMRELGYCSGIENYSRYFDGRRPGSRPFCLLDYFPDDFITIIDESHVTIPQLRAMYGGDRSRKQTLVEYGFRLPSALDNRPLKFDEFEAITQQVIYVSATPGDYELQQSQGVFVEQLIRPTGLLDPIIEVRPSINQIDDLLDEISAVVEQKQRVLVTTLTKRMAEELTKYLNKLNVNSRYIHSDIDTLERVEIMLGLRNGTFDVLVGVNLLREGLDLPEVSLVAILDADKEGFLRSERSLTQTAGRAARNVNSKVIMYADHITGSMQRTIDETNRRRSKQLAYNEKHNITPRSIIKSMQNVLGQKHRPDQDSVYPFAAAEPAVVSDPVMAYWSEAELKKAIQNAKKAMNAAVKELDFIEAARLRDEIKLFEDQLNKIKL